MQVKIQQLKWYETVGIIVLVLLFLVLLFIPLPDVVLHYDLYGIPNRVGNLGILAIIPLSGIVTFLLCKMDKKL